MMMHLTVKLTITLVLVSRCHGFITGIAVRLPLPGEQAPPGSPWPLPKSWTRYNELKTINPEDFRFHHDGSGCDVIDKAFERYASLIKLDRAGRADSGLAQLRSLKVSAREKRCEASYYPHADMDESYTLDVRSSDEATIQSETIWGALRGLETFSQLLFLTSDKVYRINQTLIQDSPRYSHRGLHVDTARHFIPVPKLLQILDAMSWDKLNLFHWHVVDDQSFPYPSRTFPNLTELGSFTPSHRYSRNDVTYILNEARLRGIRVIPEFDTPGHTHSWGYGLPQLLTPCYGQNISGGPYVPNYPIHGPAEILNPMEEYTYEVLDQLYQEIVEDFPDEYVHLGMDEVYYACWMTNPNISAWMPTMNFTEYSDVEGYFQRRLLNITQLKGAKTMLWQDPIDNNVSVSTASVIFIWKETKNGQPGQFLPWQDYMNTVTRKGYDVVLTAPWYLNVISYGQDWREYYEIEPNNFTTDPQLQAHVKGGQACMWMEYADGSNILSRLWPRLSAVSERLWSRQDTRDTDSAAYRIDQQRCRMVRRGIPAQPILPGYCGDYEPGITSGSASSQRVCTRLLTSLVLMYLALRANRSG